MSGDRKALNRTKFFRTCTAAISKAGARQVVAVVSTDGVDRDRDRLRQGGWQIENFMKNPVITAYHDYRRPPVGRALDARVTPRGLEMRVEFTPPEINPEGASIGEMYADGWMNTFSVGFQPLKWVENELGGRDYLEQELLEVAAVVVPANPGALVVARSKGLDLSPVVLELTDDPGEAYLEIDGPLPSTGAGPEVYDVDPALLAQAVRECLGESVDRHLARHTGRLD